MLLLSPLLRPILEPILAAVLTSITPPNLLRYSEQFDNAVWAATDATITANNTGAPDGLTTADKLLEAATTNIHQVAQSVTLAAGDTVTFSTYVKGGLTRNHAVLTILDPGNFRAWIDLTTGQVTNVTAGCTAVSFDAGGGWWRIAVTRTIATAGARSCIIGAASAAGTSGYAGNTANGIYIWGAQLVRGIVPGAYRATV